MIVNLPNCKLSRQQYSITRPDTKYNITAIGIQSRVPMPKKINNKSGFNHSVIELFTAQNHFDISGAGLLNYPG